MTAPIVQSVTFSASPRRLYDLYMSPAGHAAFTGAKVKISPKPGSAFSAFDGYLTGTTVAVIPGRLIVQRWRSIHWKKSDPDSTLVITFSPAGKKGRIDLVHVDVPQHDHAGVIKGWRKYYWTPLTAYLRGKSKPGAAGM